MLLQLAAQGILQCPPECSHLRLCWIRAMCFWPSAFPHEIHDRRA